MTRANALLLMFCAPVLWSTAGVVTRHVERADGFELVFWRSLFAFAFVLAVKREIPNLKSAPTLLSGVLWAVMFSTFMLALSLTSTANTLVVMSIGPLLTAIATWIVLREPVPGRTWLAAV